jgi:enoyl-[acyl-carrier protein] reductase I
MLLNGKRILVTGVVSPDSIAYAIARLAQREGAEVVLTGFGRGLRITQRLAALMDKPCDVYELDVTLEGHFPVLAEQLRERWGRIDGIVHSIAFAPPNALGGRFVSAPWPDVATSLHVSTYSFVAFGRHFGPLLASAGGGSLVGLDFDASLAWPGYDWMGVAKAGLESASRYLAAALGTQCTRVNLVAAGPIRTVAAAGIASFDDLERSWVRRAPLGWDSRDPQPVARVVCALLSDWLPAMTGEILHVDGGAHAVGDAASPGGAELSSSVPSRSLS